MDRIPDPSTCVSILPRRRPSYLLPRLAYRTALELFRERSCGFAMRSGGSELVCHVATGIEDLELSDHHLTNGSVVLRGT